MKRLGVNIDHVATIRNARGEKHPDPCLAAIHVIKFGADSVTIHLREDRRHINDLDAMKICKLKNIFVNLEVSMNENIIKKALKIKPDYVCIVPEKRKEITTEGGLNLDKNKKKLKNIIKKFKKAKIRTSLFINPKIKDIQLSKKLNADCVEIHTGRISNLVKFDSIWPIFFLFLLEEFFNKVLFSFLIHDSILIYAFLYAASALILLS